jgi:PhzF family phenazine biosynthesis protein
LRDRIVCLISEGEGEDGPVTFRRFRQVDVFTAVPYAGNPVAVVLDAEGLDDDLLQRFAAWTNLSETTFVLPPENPAADYRLRIFTPSTELPFAGHPTLGSCHAWLEAGGTPKQDDVVVQECAAGLVPIRHADGGLAFVGPPLLRSGPVEEATLARVLEFLRVDPGAVVDSNWLDNGPGWIGVLLDSADAVLRLRPGSIDLDVGVVGPYPPGSPQDVEVRAFFEVNGMTREDPATGSLNAALAEWLLGSGRLTAPYTARQGTALGRDARVRITRDPDGRIWTGGAALTCVTGEVDLG